MAKSTATAKAKKSVPKKAAPQKVVKKIAKKAAAIAKPEKKKDTVYIKYEDKSAGQPEMVIIFEAMRKMFKPYAGKHSLKLHENTYGHSMLVSHKPVEINGRIREAFWFACALIQKGYVGFYYHIEDAMKKEFGPQFIKTLKGKGCFHIKKNDPLIMSDIKKAIKLGYDDYLKRGWI